METIEILCASKFGVCVKADVSKQCFLNQKVKNFYFIALLFLYEGSNSQPCTRQAGAYVTELNPQLISLLLVQELSYMHHIPFVKLQSLFIVWSLLC